MSSILEGADIAYLREYNESEDERRLDALQDSIGSIRKATKGGKYLGSDVIDIMVQVQGFAEQLGIDPKELDYAENQVREAQNNLESAIYGLEEPFEDAIRTLQNRIDDVRMDAEDLDEAGTNCWKGYEKKGTKKMFGKTVNNCVKKESVEAVDEDLKAWFGKGKDGGAGGGGWDAYDGSGNRTGKCGDSKGKAKPKCLSKSKAASLRSSGGKKAIGAAVKKKRRNDPNKNRKGKAKNVSSKTNESRILQGLTEGLNTPTPFQIVQDVYKNKQHQKIDGVVMDLFTASALVNAYDQINDANKKKMENADIAMLGKMASKIFELSESMELEEGNGNIRMGILGMLLVSGIWQIDRNMAEKIWDNSHQLQQLTQVYAKANECGDKEKMKDVKRRIANHKTRLDIGKGDVDFDGLPGNDDIKDIGYATQSCDIR